MHRADDESDESEKSEERGREKEKGEERRVYFEKEEGGWEGGRGARGVVGTRQREYIKFNLNQLSFIDVARISDTCHQKLDTCT